MTSCGRIGGKIGTLTLVNVPRDELGVTRLPPVHQLLALELGREVVVIWTGH